MNVIIRQPSLKPRDFKKKHPRSLVKESRKQPHINSVLAIPPYQTLIILCLKKKKVLKPRSLCQNPPDVLILGQNDTLMFPGRERCHGRALSQCKAQVLKSFMTQANRFESVLIKPCSSKFFGSGLKFINLGTPCVTSRSCLCGRASKNEPLVGTINHKY